MINFLKEFLSVISHVLNVLTGGSRFYTFSARTHYCSQVLKLKNWDYIEKAVDMLFFWQEAHCKQEFKREEHGRWAPY
tara:strand:- start:33 stop:266 length:234 start_codon:yes stop_codon:yes gene_type:complete